MKPSGNVIFLGELIFIFHSHAINVQFYKLWNHLYFYRRIFMNCLYSTNFFECNFLEYLLCVSDCSLIFYFVTLWVKVLKISRKIEPLQIDDSTHTILESTVFNWNFQSISSKVIGQTVLTLHLGCVKKHQWNSLFVFFFMNTHNVKHTHPSNLTKRDSINPFQKDPFQKDTLISNMFLLVCRTLSDSLSASSRFSELQWEVIC